MVIDLADGGALFDLIIEAYNLTLHSEHYTPNPKP